MRLSVILLSLIIAFNARAEVSKDSGQDIPYFVYEIHNANINPTESSPANTIPSNQPFTSQKLEINTNTPDEYTLSSVGVCSLISSFVIKPLLKKLTKTTLTSAIPVIREAVCQKAGDADAKVWIYINADGRVGLGTALGVGGQTGIEIVFHCKETTEKK